MIELLVVVATLLVLSAIGLPSLAAMLRNTRVQGDARSVAAQVALARMRAAADFSQARLFVNLTANTYRVDVWNKAGAGGAGCWQADSSDNSVVACAPAGTAAAPQDIPLSAGNSVGLGGAPVAPPGTQTVFGQAPACQDNGGNAIANTACVVFNSRSIPVTPGFPGTPVVNNTATGNDAIYLDNNAGLTFAVTVSASGKTSLWCYGRAWTQF